MKKSKKPFVLLFIIAISVFPIFSAIGRMPWWVILKNHPMHRQTVEIGVILADQGSYSGYEPIYALAEEDINDYYAKLGYRLDISFIIRDADGQASIHLDEVENFHAMDVNLLIAGHWSSQALTALEYVNEYKMLMFSPSSTYYTLAIPGDNLYRLTPTDNYQVKALAELLRAHAINYLVVLQLGIDWGYGISSALDDEWEGDIVTVVYPEEARGNSTYDFTEYLEDAEAATGVASDDKALLLISFAEANGIMRQVDDNPSFGDLDKLVWYGVDAIAQLNIESDVVDAATRYMLYSTKAAPTRSEKWYEFCDRLGYEPGFYEACAYDIAWVYAKAVLEASIDAPEGVKMILEDVSDQYYGVTGWCNLNDAGDREPLDYDVWKFGTYDWVRIGKWDKYTENIEWYEP